MATNSTATQKTTRSTSMPSHKYVTYSTGGAAVAAGLMCLRMDVLTVRRGRWRWEGRGGGGGGGGGGGVGDAAAVAVHQQRWDTPATTSQCADWREVMGLLLDTHTIHLHGNISCCSGSKRFKSRPRWGGVTSHIKDNKAESHCLLSTRLKGSYVGQSASHTRTSSGLQCECVCVCVCVISADPDALKHWLSCGCIPLPE